jgi:hypothetical protein
VRRPQKEVSRTQSPFGADPTAENEDTREMAAVYRQKKRKALVKRWRIRTPRGARGVSPAKKKLALFKAENEDTREMAAVCRPQKEKL